MKHALTRMLGLALAMLGLAMLATDLLYFVRTGSSAPPFFWLRSGTGFVFWLLGFHYMRDT